MKKILISVVVMSSLLVVSGVALANGDHGHADEVAQGEQLVEDEVSCSELDDDQLVAIGEYFMERMHPGDMHDLMHQRMGIEEGTQEHDDFHINMAKTLYCSEGPNGTIPITNMMMDGWSGPSGSNNYNNPMMNFGFGSFGWGGWIFMVLFWGLVIAGGISVVKWLVGEREDGGSSHESALEIAKKRYAEGEINEEEFHEIKEELTS